MNGTRHHPASRAAVIGVRFAVVLALALLTATTAFARTPTAKERGLLDFIGTLESNGYDDYYRNVAESPPRRLTTMTVGEVLDWQDRIDARSNSEAAGRYQIMEDTLRGLVRQGVVPEDALFDATTQDALAVYLLDQRGWDPNRTGPNAGTDLARMGDAIAREWAALPVCSGIRAGRSAYDGLAGNSARTTCDVWLKVLANPDDPVAVADAIALSRIIAASRAGQLSSPLETFLEDTRDTFFDLTSKLIPIATRLLFSLLLIEWVWTTARQVSEGADIVTYLSTLTRRVALASIFLFLINLSDYSDLVIRSAEALLGITMQGASIKVSDLFDQILSLAFELFGRTWYNLADKLAAFVILIVGAMLIGLIVTAYIEVYIAFAAAVIALGFAGWSGTREIAVSYLKKAAVKVISLFTALFCGALISQLVTLELNEESGGPVLLAGLLIILAMIMIRAPAAMEQAMTGKPGKSAAGRLAALIGGGVAGAIWKLSTAKAATRGIPKG